MPASVGDEAMGTVNVLIAIAATALMVYTVLMRFCYGTLNIAEAGRTYKKRSEVEELYENAFSRRESLRYHIGWAKSRGDHDDAAALTSQLQTVDKELDMIEDRMRSISKASSAQAH